MENDAKGLGHYLAVFNRRRWQFVLPTVVILAIAVFAALVIPPVYRSSATILIEQQQIPPDLVRSTVMSFAAERVQVITFRVLTTAKLGEIIERFDLYPETRKNLSLPAVAREMREDIEVKMVKADVLEGKGTKGDGSMSAAIAFKVSYDHPMPRLAQKVSSELVTLFLNENLRTRREAARETSKFIAAEAERLAGEISSFEAKLATFKEQHADNLPERQAVNLQLMQRIEDQLRANEQSARMLEERKIFLQSGLAQIDPYTTAVSGGGERVQTPAERLRTLEVQYVGIAARYASDHPDRVNMEREMAALRRVVGKTDSAGELKRRLAEQKTELATLRDRYSADHPDIKKLQRAIAATEKQIAAAGRNGAVDAEVTSADNPAYIQLQTQLQAADAELRSLEDERKHLLSKRAELELVLTRAPAVEREYKTLVRDYDNSVAKYKELKAKEMTAELAESLEAESKGERFSLLEPPQAPDKPYSPNRLAILLIGAIFAFGGGLGHVIARESADSSVRGSRIVTNIIGAPPIGVIPFIVTEQEATTRRRRRMAWIAGCLVVLVAAVIAVHFLFGPLDLLWYRTLNRLELVFMGTAA
jgi:uncharacterized protein involved in exopolysaccharide biosynthesis